MIESTLVVVGIGLSAVLLIVWGGMTVLFTYHLVRYLAFYAKHGRKPQPWEF